MRTSHHTERHSSSSSCTISKSENCTRLLSLLSHKFTWSNLLNIWQMWLLFPSTLDIALLQDLFNWLIFLLLAKTHISIPHSNKWPSVMYQSDLSKWPIFIWKVLFLYLNRSHCLQDKTLIPWHCIVSSLIIYSLLSLQRSPPYPQYYIYVSNNLVNYSQFTKLPWFLMSSCFWSAISYVTPFPLLHLNNFHSVLHVCSSRFSPDWCLHSSSDRVLPQQIP